MKQYSISLALLMTGTLTLLASATGHAEVSRSCKVSYQTSDGWSSEYLVEVDFMSGVELFRKTADGSYGPLDAFAMVWFGPGEVAIIKLNPLIPVVAGELESEHFRRMFLVDESVQGSQVNAANGRTWKIRAKEFGQFIDSRGRPHGATARQSDVRPIDVCNCRGDTSPSGPCYAGLGGPAYNGPGGPAYAGPGGPCYRGPGGPLYDGPGGPRYRGPGGPLYDGPGGPCYDRPGGPCYPGPGGSLRHCPTECR